MGDLYTSKFWKDASERIVSSAVQGFAVGGGLFKAGEFVAQVNVVGFPWLAALGGAGGMALLTLVKSLGAAKLGDEGTASAVKQ